MMLLWDATCTNTFAATHLLDCSVNPGAAARAVEDRKRQKYTSSRTWADGSQKKLVSPRRPLGSSSKSRLHFHLDFDYSLLSPVAMGMQQSISCEERCEVGVGIAIWTHHLKKLSSIPKGFNDRLMKLQLPLVLGPATRNHQDENDAEIQKLLEEKCQLLQVHQNDPTSTAKKAAFVSKHSIVQARLRSIQDAWLSSKTNEIQGFADRHDTKRFYDALKAVYRPPSIGSSPLRSADGTTLLKSKEILERWAEHFDTVLNRPSSINNEAIACLPKVAINPNLDIPPSMEEPVSAEVLAVVGQEVKLSYEVTSHPSPTPTWTRPDQGLKPVTHLDPRIQAADTGVYTCQVTNPGGRLYREVEVVVEVPPHLTLLPRTAEVTQGARGCSARHLEELQQQQQLGEHNLDIRDLLWNAVVQET
ncbi:hypothetical protein Pcinc_016296 [Petrolisthes cinctipes]|uniref:Ig-like domain-containing protein n=1 Tax=Petrolisthes cinctipes TaxID=88211 RepID=A0AAE1FWL4_PETCI|nr:hypothetical protein Pcinc_016296 [Petrolisthes cinctipes]